MIAVRKEMPRAAAKESLRLVIGGYDDADAVRRAHDALILAGLARQQLCVFGLAGTLDEAAHPTESLAWRQVDDMRLAVQSASLFDGIGLGASEPTAGASAGWRDRRRRRCGAMSGQAGLRFSPAHRTRAKRSHARVSSCSTTRASCTPSTSAAASRAIEEARRDSLARRANPVSMREQHRNRGAREQISGDAAEHPSLSANGRSRRARSCPRRDRPLR